MALDPRLIRDAWSSVPAAPSLFRITYASPLRVEAIILDSLAADEDGYFPKRAGILRVFPDGARLDLDEPRDLLPSETKALAAVHRAITETDTMEAEHG